MKLKRDKLFSKKKDKERSDSDKKWDSVLGAGLGATAGVLGSKKLAKVTKGLRDTNDNDFLLNISEKNGLYKNQKRKEELLSKIPQHRSPDEEIELKNLGEESKILLKKSKKALKRFKLKKRAAKVGIAALPVAGAVVGSLYGHDNNLKKQRDKIENAAGDRAVEIIRGNKKK